MAAVVRGCVVAALGMAAASGSPVARCDLEMNVRPRLERVDTAFEQPVDDEGHSWMPYRVTSADRACVYEPMHPQREEACLRGTWLVVSGGSNAAVQAEHMRMVMLGKELMDKFYAGEVTQNYAGQTVEGTVLRQVGIEDDFFGIVKDYSTKNNDIVCWGEGCEKNVTAFEPDHGYYTYLAIHTLGDVIPFFEDMKPDNLDALPTPVIVIGADIWLGYCYNRYMRGERRMLDNIYKECDLGYNEIADLPRSTDTYIRHQVELMHRNLAYFRDEWPHVKEIIQEANAWARRLKPYFPDSVIEENSYPKVIWSELAIDFDKGVEGAMMQDWHWMGRMPILKNHRLLDYVCKDTRTETIRHTEPFVYMRDDCVIKNARQSWQISDPCYSYADGTSGFQVLEDADKQPTQAARSITLQDGEGGDADDDGDTSTARSEFPLPRSSYHILLMAFSVLVLGTGAFVVYRPLLVRSCSTPTNSVEKPEQEGDAQGSRTSLRTTASSSTATSDRKDTSESTRRLSVNVSGVEPLVERVSSSEEASLEQKDGAIENVAVVANSSVEMNPNEKKPAGPASLQSIDDVEQNLKASKGFQQGGGRPKKLLGLGMARYIASVHIVLGHLRNGVTPPGGEKAFPLDDLFTNGWGFSWVPFFMMLSGFVLSYARLNSSNPTKYEHWMTFTWKRIRGIYPLFLCGLIARAGQNAILRDSAFTFGTPLETFSLFFLVQAWFPSVVVQGLQAHCWFLSCIVPYWAAHQFMYSRLRITRTCTLWVLALVFSVVPFLLLTLIPPALGLSVTWYSSWDGWTMRTMTHNLIAILKFHPLCYFHIYVFGIVAAILMHRRETFHPAVQAVFRNGALIGFVGLYAIFGLSYWVTIPAYKLTCRLGVLAPLQGLYLIGLSLESDPVARLFSLAIFAPLENLSFPQYVFQFIAFSSWFAWMTPGFWLWLNALSLLGYFFVQSPLKSKHKPLKVQAAGAVSIFALAGLVGLVTFLFRSTGALTAHLVGSAPFVNLTRGAWDLRLNEPLASTLDGGDRSRGIINPSLLWSEESEELWVAYRTHKYARTFVGNQIEERWESNVLVGRLDPLTFLPIEEFRSPFDENTFAWEPSGEPVVSYDVSNGTFLQRTIIGPEDPRLLKMGNSLVVTTNVHSPTPVEGPPSNSGISRRMMIGDLNLETQVFGTAKLLQSTSNIASEMEKNWLAFEHRGELKFVQMIHPFRVLRAAAEQPASAVAENRVQMEVESSLLQKQFPNLSFGNSVNIHGGCNPLPVIFNETRLEFADSSVETDTYLSVFHVIKSSGEYTNYMFLFSLHEDEPETGLTNVWLIDRVSSELSLFASQLTSGVSTPMTFASGLTATQDGVLVSYGSSNVEGRVRFMPWDLVSDFFELEA